MLKVAHRVRPRLVAALLIAVVGLLSLASCSSGPSSTLDEVRKDKVLKVGT